MAFVASEDVSRAVILFIDARSWLESRCLALSFKA
jgi:hypothetical protein